MKFPILDLSRIDIEAQYIKLMSEVEELVEAYCDDYESLTEELFDVIQTAIGLLIKINSKGDMEQAVAKHNKKLREYEKIGRIPAILGWVKLTGDKDFGSEFLEK